MTSETITSARPARVLDAARRFFTGTGRYADAWIEDESDTHVAFGTFRGSLAVAAFADPEDPERTRIRVTTLRDEGLVPRLLTYLEGLEDG